MWFLLIGALTARADVVGPEPEDCPAGSIGTSNHSGAYCTPRLCADSPCDDGVCETTGLCVLEEERQCGGMTTPGSPCTYTHREVFGTCEGDGDCSEGSCVIDEYCVDPSSKDSEICGCASTGGPTAVLLLGLLPLALRRRRPARG